MSRWIVIAVLAASGACGGGQAQQPAPIEHAAPPPSEQPAAAQAPPPVVHDDPANTAPECVHYRRALDHAETCPQLPTETKDALEKGYAAMSAGWSGFSDLPPDVKKAIDDACRAAADASDAVSHAFCK